MATTESYRIAQEELKSSSEEGELSSDDDIKNGIAEHANEMDTKLTQPTVLFSSEQSCRRQPKNIWSQVLADQSSNDISSSMGTVGMKGFMSR